MPAPVDTTPALVPPTAPAAPMVRLDALRDAARWAAVRRRYATAGGVQAVLVPSGATSVAVTFGIPEKDTLWVGVATPTWLTTVAVTSPTLTGCTLTFGTAPGADSRCALAILRPD